MQIKIDNILYTLDTEDKNFKQGEKLLQHMTGLLNHWKKDGSHSIEPRWYVLIPESDRMARFHSLVANTHKIIKIEEL